jgi:hypothetical protein
MPLAALLIGLRYLPGRLRGRDGGTASLTTPISEAMGAKRIRSWQ